MVARRRLGGGLESGVGGSLGGGRLQARAGWRRAGSACLLGGEAARLRKVLGAGGPWAPLPRGGGGGVPDCLGFLRTGVSDLALLLGKVLCVVSVLSVSLCVVRRRDLGGEEAGLVELWLAEGKSHRSAILLMALFMGGPGPKVCMISQFAGGGRSHFTKYISL